MKFRYVLLIVLFAFSSCGKLQEQAMRRKLVKIESKKPYLLDEACLQYNPTKDSTWSESEVTEREDSIVYIPSPPVYINCDSALKSAENGSETGQKPDLSKVAVNCPPSQQVVKWKLKTNTRYIKFEDTKHIDLLKHEKRGLANQILNLSNDITLAQADVIMEKKSKRKWRSRFLWLSGILLILIAGTVIVKYYSSFLKKLPF